MKLSKGMLNITMDGQFGSTGKGLLNDYIVQNFDNKPDICISNAAPNAGHTYVDDQGNKRTVFHLPVSGVLLPQSIIYLCAGSIIDPAVLNKEVADFGVDPSRIYIHPRACILLPEHKDREALDTSGATSIASTRKGVGAALGDKVARVSGTRTAEQYYTLNPRIKPFHILDINLMDEMNVGRTCLMEVPQGFSLSLNHGRSYPQCTSRDLTVAQALNDAGVHPKHLGQVIVSLRSYPIRVGNIVDDNGVEIGNSGSFYPDSTEKTWVEMGQMPELTTVTKRVRRIATFSYIEYAKMLKHLRPDTVFLNFCNYFKNFDEFKECILRMRLVESTVSIMPKHMYGFGPAAADCGEFDSLEAAWFAYTSRRTE